MASNYRWIDRRTAIVRTQAGLMSAINELWDGDTEDLEVYGFPTEYPSVVVITSAYAGYHYCQCYSMHVNKMLAELEGE